MELIEDFIRKFKINGKQLSSEVLKTIEDAIKFSKESSDYALIMIKHVFKMIGEFLFDQLNEFNRIWSEQELRNYFIKRSIEISSTIEWTVLGIQIAKNPQLLNEYAPIFVRLYDLFGFNNIVNLVDFQNKVSEWLSFGSNVMMVFDFVIGSKLTIDLIIRTNQINNEANGIIIEKNKLNKIGLRLNALKYSIDEIEKNINNCDFNGGSLDGIKEQVKKLIDSLNIIISDLESITIKLGDSEKKLKDLKKRSEIDAFFDRVLSIYQGARGIFNMVNGNYVYGLLNFGLLFLSEYERDKNRENVEKCKKILIELSKPLETAKSFFEECKHSKVRLDNINSAIIKAYDFQKILNDHKSQNSQLKTRMQIYEDENERLRKEIAELKLSKNL